MPEIDKCDYLGEVKSSIQIHQNRILSELRSKAKELGGNTVITQSFYESAGVVDIEGGKGGMVYFEHSGKVYKCP